MGLDGLPIGLQVTEEFAELVHHLGFQGFCLEFCHLVSGELGIGGGVLAASAAEMRAVFAAHAAAHGENGVEVAAHLGRVVAVIAAEGAEQVDAHGW